MNDKIISILFNVIFAQRILSILSSPMEKGYIRSIVDQTGFAIIVSIIAAFFIDKDNIGQEFLIYFLTFELTILIIYSYKKLRQKKS
jgi:hypothetical protein